MAQETLLKGIVSGTQNKGQINMKVNLLVKKKLLKFDEKHQLIKLIFCDIKKLNQT